MKDNYLIIFLLIIAILFRGSIFNLLNNVASYLISKDESLEVKVLNDKINRLYNEYNSLLDFKNNINIKEDYIITNVLKNNYGFGNLIIPNGDFNLNNEVINEEGLVGIISKKNNKTAEIKKTYDTNLIVKINNETGKIYSKDEDLNLIIKDVSNYNNISINDEVFSISGNYIGKVIKIQYDILDNYLTVRTIDFNNLTYVAVIKDGA
ncbi:MAG TPA: hypothetical protein GX713_01895 [Mollicutes bacterium]|nr:hypothetical protein [Mollicutes bacterium]